MRGIGYLYGVCQEQSGSDLNMERGTVNHLLLLMCSWNVTVQNCLTANAVSAITLMIKGITNSGRLILNVDGNCREKLPKEQRSNHKSRYN
jgi:hypothetical protein